MMVRVVTFSAIFLAATSVVAAAETRDDGGRLGIGQGANSCLAWTRSHEAKAATPSPESTALTKPPARQDCELDGLILAIRRCGPATIYGAEESLHVE